MQFNPHWPVSKQRQNIIGLLRPVLRTVSLVYNVFMIYIYMQCQYIMDIFHELLMKSLDMNMCKHAQ